MNSNQYNSLPHTTGGVNVGTRGPSFHANPNNNTGTQQVPRPNQKKKFNNKKNYNKSGNNIQNNNNNNNNNVNNCNNVKQQPFNNYTNNPDYGHSSLPHTSQCSPSRYSNQYSAGKFGQFGKFGCEDAPETLKSFGNNVPVPTMAKTSPLGNTKRHNNSNKHKRGGGSNNNYRGTGPFTESERLNKSFNKDESSPNNSFTEITNKMSTSFSLDSINLNASQSLATSHSFTSHPRALKLSEVETIIEQEAAEGCRDGNYPSLEGCKELASNLDSGVDSNSYCSMPAADAKNLAPLTADMLSSIEVEEAEESSRPSTSSSSSSAPDSPNQNGYETAISQMVSEAEVSFGYDSVNADNVESNTISNLNIEASFFQQIEAAVLESYLKKNLSADIKIVDVQTVEEFVSADNDTTTSCASDSSDNGSFKEEVEPVLASKAESTAPEQENTMERVEEPAIQSETLIEKNVVPEQIAEEFVVKTADSEPILEQSEVIAEENTTVCVNLVPETANTMDTLDRETEAQLKIAEQEVNDLVNKIVLDVITQAVYAAPLVQESKASFVEAEAPNFMSLEQEISQLEESEKAANKSATKCIDDMELSFIDNDSSIVDVVESKVEEEEKDTTEAILSHNENILKASPLRIVPNKKNTVATKEPPVDCFSCTIS